MTRGVRLLLARSVALLAALTVAVPVAAQGRDPLERALVAYRALDFEVAAERFRAALAPDATPPLTARDSIRALMFLGATEHFRERRADALEAFATLLAMDPRYRPDDLTFPPEVTARFNEARVAVRAATVTVPDSASIFAPADQLPIRIHVAGPHDVRALMLDPRGLPLRLLHEGEVRDSLDLGWNARDAAGRLLDAGAYTLQVLSRGQDGGVIRTLEVPVLVERLARDTLWTPELQSSSLRPETTPVRTSWRPVVLGLLAAGGVVALPSMLGGGSDGLAVRHVVAVSLGVGGIIGSVAGSRPVPAPENVEWNRRVRERFAREVEFVREENERRRSESRLRLRTGAPQVIRP